MRSSGKVLAAACGLLLAVAALRAQSNVPAIYKDALAREAAIRQELDAARPDVPADWVLTRLRTLVGAFEDLARLFPTADTSDDALWHGGQLSADAFWKLSQERDRVTALRLLEVLRVRYPVSPLTKQLAPHLSRLTQARAGQAAATGTTGTSASAATPPPSRPATVPAATPTATSPSTATKPAPPMVASPAPARPAPAVAAAPASPSAPAAGTAAPRASAPTSTLGTLKAIRREPLKDVLRITLELDTEVPFHHERIEGPPRVFIDLENTRTVDALRDTTLPFADDLVRTIRVGRHAGSRTRVVLDLRDAGRYSVYSLYNPYRLVFDFERATGATPRPVVDPAVRPALVPPVPGAAAAVPPAASSSTPSSASGAVTRMPAGSAASPGAAPAPAPGGPGGTPPLAPSANSDGGFSLSRQLGLGISRIVIDPGHGGRDPGAKTQELNEAELVLDIALRLEKLLIKEGVEVVLTRRADGYLSLEERTALANRAGADLFLSIHANASAISTARGVETYFLNLAPNREAEAIAARENAGSTQTMRNLPDIVKAIALNDKIDESRDFATSVQGALYERLRRVDRNARNLGVKQAPFMVLIGATMPSVLVEIAFLTHRQEATLLKTEKYRQQVAEALSAGITRYQRSVKQIPAIAAK